MSEMDLTLTSANDFAFLTVLFAAGVLDGVSLASELFLVAVLFRAGVFVARGVTGSMFSEIF